MERILGIGGVFFKARDPKALAAWYREQDLETISPTALSPPASMPTIRCRVGSPSVSNSLCADTYI